MFAFKRGQSWRQAFIEGMDRMSEYKWEIEKKLSVIKTISLNYGCYEEAKRVMTVLRTDEGNFIVYVVGSGTIWTQFYDDLDEAILGAIIKAKEFGHEVGLNAFDYKGLKKEFIETKL